MIVNTTRPKLNFVFFFLMFSCSLMPRHRPFNNNNNNNIVLWWCPIVIYSIFFLHRFNIIPFFIYLFFLFHLSFYFIFFTLCFVLYKYSPLTLMACCSTSFHGLSIHSSFSMFIYTINKQIMSTWGNSGRRV